MIFDDGKYVLDVAEKNGLFNVKVVLAAQSIAVLVVYVLFDQSRAEFPRHSLTCPNIKDIKSAQQPDS